MFLPKPLRKWAAVFRGDVAPVLILLSTACGLCFGLIPGFYGMHVALLLLVLVLNVHLGLFLMTAAIGRALAYAAAPLWYHLGLWLHGHGGFPAGLLAGLPVLALTDFSRYSVLATLVAGPVLGLLAGGALALSVRTFRLAWLKLEEGSDAFRRFHASRWVRLLEWLLLGKRADVRAALQRPVRYVRLPGVIAAVVLLLAFVGGSYVLAGRNLGPQLARQLGRLNGAEVNVRQAGVNVLSGRVHLAGLQCTDPQKPDHNRIAIAQAEAKLRPASLLFGQVVLDEVTARDVAFDQPRGKPGRVFEPPPKPAPQTFEPAQFTLPTPDVVRLERYVRDADAVRKQLAQLERWLPQRSATTTPPTPQPPRGYLAYLTARAPDEPVPRLIVRALRLDPVDIPAPAFGPATLTAANLSDAPAALPEPVRVEIRSKHSGGVITAMAKLAAEVPEVSLTGELPKLDLHQLQQRLRDDNPLLFESGTADVRIEGAIRGQQIDATLNVKMTRLKVRAGGSQLFGLKADVARQALDAIESLQVPLRVVGPLREPRIAVDTKAVQRQLRDALVAAGKAELARQVDALLADKLPAGVPDAKQILDNPGKALHQGVQKGLKQGVGSLLGGEKKDDAGGKKDKKKAEKKKARSAIEDLRKRLGKP